MDCLTVYHGTTITNCKSIMEMKKFNNSVSNESLFQSIFSRKNTYQWLGDGVYFWVNNLDIAKYWARMVSERYEEHAAVIETQICFENNRCFNLCTEPHRKLIEELINGLIQKNSEFNDFQDLPRSEQNKFIGFACDFLFKKGNNMIRDYDLIYYVFIIDDTRFPQKQTAQVCIKNDKVIKYDDMVIVWNS